MDDPVVGSPLGGFTVVERVDAGGMGRIYRARDAAGAPVALKLMLGVAAGPARERFEREARVLSGLTHPGIVRYRAHGEDPLHGPFLAMEWLEGEDLAARLARAPLDVDESLLVARQVALALAYAHEHGVVHRDIKPANLFLVGREPGDVRTVDFGIARPRGAAALTGTGATIGTVGYMAPEQAEGRRDADARADLFSLGCVLYECLVGAPAFAGDHFVAVLVKILRESPPPPREARPELPAALDALVLSLLEKDPARRPSTARELARALEGVGATRAPAPAPHRSRARSQEQRILQVALVDPDAGAQLGLAPTVAAEPVVAPGDVTLSPEHIERCVAAVQRATARFGADLTPLRNGMVLVAMPERGSARDRAEAAASAALAVLEASPSARVALASGRGDPASADLGACVERCVAMLAGIDAGEAGLDEPTARLLEERFVVEGARRLLRGERRSTSGERRLLGKIPPCVGRAKELALLQATITECFEEHEARSFLVTAAPGAGKSRLVRELVRRRPSGERIVAARGDPLEAGWSLAILRGIVRAAAEIEPEADSPACALALSGLLSDCASREPVVELLCELLGRPVGAARTPELRAARADASELRAWLARSFCELLGALADRGPVLLVLDDLHWADGASVAILGEALRRLHDRSLFVLGAARPEVDALFAAPWPASQRLALEPLPKRAAADLVRSALGAEASDAVVARVVDRAQGNAFFLEELVRAAASGRDELPETVQAMVEARLLDVEARARAALRAASVLGERCDAAGVASLSGGTAQEAGQLLGDLASAELLHLDRAGREEYTFRHAIVRDVAYAMIAGAELPVLHGRAARWLESRGRLDPVALALHFERAGEVARATEYHVQSMELAYAVGDFLAAQRRADELLGRPLEREQRARVQVMRGGILIMRGADDMLACSQEAAELSPIGSPIWVRATGGVASGAALLGRIPELVAALRSLGSVEVEPTALHGVALWNGMAALAFLGRPELIAPLVDQIERGLRLEGSDPVFSLFARAALGGVACVIADPPFAGGLARALRLTREATRLREPIAGHFVRLASLIAAGFALSNAGHRAEAEGALRSAWEESREPGLATFSLLSAFALVSLEPARTDLEVPEGTTPGGRGLSLAARAELAFARRDDAVAARLGAEAHELSAFVRFLAPSSATLLARVALRRGDLDEALARARAAVEAQRGGCCWLAHRAETWRCLAEVLRARGESAAADEVLGQGRARLRAACADLDGSDRARFAAAEPYVAFGL